MKKIIIVLWILLLPTIAFSNKLPVDQAVLSCRKTSKPMICMNKLAVKNNKSAQFLLGFAYSTGQGIDKNPKQAFYWLSKSVKQDYAPAQWALGFMYYKGNGVLKDFKQAFYWFDKSAKQGCPPGEYNLGVMYYNGWGTSKDLKQAFYWYDKSAKQGNTDAQNDIADMYYNGYGTHKDNIKAYAWASVSVSLNDSAKELLNKVKQDMSADEITQGEALVKQILSTQK